jgi:hypothetical protein
MRPPAFDAACHPWPRHFYQARTTHQVIAVYFKGITFESVSKASDLVHFFAVKVALRTWKEMTDIVAGSTIWRTNYAKFCSKF